MDFANYTPQVDHYCLDAVFTSLAQRVGQQIKYARLGEGYGNPTLKKAFEALCLAQVVRRITSVVPAGLPLGASASVKVFKSLMLDLGLMRYLSGMPDDIELICLPSIAAPWLNSLWDRRCWYHSREASFTGIGRQKAVPPK
jgi:hypothetical protein